MINIREIYDKLTKLPRPNRRDTEVIIKLIYLQGREDEKKYQKSIRRNPRRYVKEAINVI